MSIILIETLWSVFKDMDFSSEKSKMPS